MVWGAEAVVSSARWCYIWSQQLHFSALQLDCREYFLPHPTMLKMNKPLHLETNRSSGSAVVERYKTQNVVTSGSLLATAVWLQGARSCSTIVYPAQLCENSGFKMYCFILWFPITFCDIMQWAQNFLMSHLTLSYMQLSFYLTFWNTLKTTTFVISFGIDCGACFLFCPALFLKIVTNHC